MINWFRRNLVVARNYLLYRKYAFWAATARNSIPLDPSANFVFSVASYPRRIHLVPAVFESLARQSANPRHAYLVLSEEDYPDQELPKPIKRLVARGVEIVWVRDNPYAVKKLMPIWGRHPDCALITFDDDIIYSRDVVSRLVEVTSGRDRCVAGYWAKALYRKGATLGMWQRVPGGPAADTPANSLYLMGGGGVWYSPGSLDDRVTDLDAVHSLVPGRGSDIWFWAAAHAVNAEHIWVPPAHSRMWIPIPQTKRTSPRETPGGDELERRFQAVIDYFGIRQKLLRELPDWSDLPVGRT